MLQTALTEKAMVKLQQKQPEKVQSRQAYNPQDKSRVRR